jgi:hypothetical protein
MSTTVQRRTKTLTIALAMLAPGFLAACGGEEVSGGQNDVCDQAATPTTTTSDGVTVTNDPCALDRQVDRTMQDIAIKPETGAVASPLKYVAGSTNKVTTLTLMATVSPPVVNGKTVQASNVAFRDNYAVVSYMTVGEPVGGAIDIIDVSNQEKPLLVSRVTFADADVVSADFNSTTVWYTGSTSATTVKTRALLGGIKINGYKFDASEKGTTSLPSYVGTGVLRTSTSDRVWAVSGAAGSLVSYTYSKGTFTSMMDLPLHDGRALYLDGDTVGVVSGTPGVLTLVSSSKKATVSKYSFSGATNVDAKSDVRLLGKKAVIAAGDAGVQILSTVTGKLVGKVALPDAKALGLAPSYVSTNGVAVNKDMLFICNGGAGIYVAQTDQDISASDSEKDVTVTMLGRLQLGVSTNHVAFSNGYLIIATGTGGLKVVKVESK